MRLLLDTNILIPMMGNDVTSLPGKVRGLLAADDMDFFASAAALWEMAIKFRIGKLKLPCMEEDIPHTITLLGLNLLPISATHAVAPVDPWPETEDPFDRMMLSVCKVERLMLVTTDKKLRDHPLAWRA